MNRKAAEFVDEHTEATKDALSLLALGILGWLSNFVSGLVADHAIYSTLADIGTLLALAGAAIRTSLILQDWKERRRMIAIKKKVTEEEAVKVAEQEARAARIMQNKEDLLYAPTAEEIAEILRRNARDKGDE